MILTNETLRQRAPIIAAICIGICLSALLLYAMSKWHKDWQLAHQVPVETVTLARNETAEMIAAIPDAHLFGRDFSKTGAIPITNLQLRVTGIVKVDTENNQSVSKAYISIAGAPGKIYLTGDSLPDGVKVYAITSDAVILENGSRLEKLPMPREKLQFKSRNIEVAT